MGSFQVELFFPYNPYIKMVIKVSFVVELIVKKIFTFVLVAQLLDRISMSVLKCTFSLHSNPFATFVKEILSRYIKTQWQNYGLIEFVS